MAHDARVVASTHHTALKKMALQSAYNRGEHDEEGEQGEKGEGEEERGRATAIAYPAAMQWQGEGDAARPTYEVSGWLGSILRLPILSIALPG